jgi:hypothetical protein
MPGDLLDDPPGDRRRQQRLPSGHHPDGGEEILGWGRLQQEPAGADLQRLEHVVVALEGGEDQHPGLVPGGCEDPPSGLQAVQSGHLDVHQHHGRTVATDRVDGLLAVLSLGDDLDVGFSLQNQPEPSADQGLVVG